MTDCADLAVVPPMPQDALSAPTGDALLPQILALLPRGAAWRTDEVADSDHSSFLHRFWRAVAEPVADLYAKTWELALQSTACTVTSGLDDWEREFGLPDSCVAVSADVTDRVAALRERVAGEGGGSIPYFVCVAARLGYEIAITEPRFFEFGVSAFESAGLVPSYFEFGNSSFGNDRFSDFAGTPANLTDAFAHSSGLTVARFEFGYSIFGNDRFSDFSGGLDAFKAYWIVHVVGAVSSYFEFGASSLGYDRFSDFRQAVDLECEFNARKPAHTTMIFDYSGVTTPAVLPQGDFFSWFWF